MELEAEKHVLLSSAIQVPLSAMGGWVGGGASPASLLPSTELLEVDDSHETHETHETPAKRQKLIVDKMMARAQ